MRKLRLREMLWTLWLLRSCQAPQEGFWLSVLPFKYGGVEVRKRSNHLFFSLVKKFNLFSSFFSLLEKQTSEILASFMILPLLRSRVRLPCRALFRDANKGWLQDLNWVSWAVNFFFFKRGIEINVQYIQLITMLHIPSVYIETIKSPVKPWNINMLSKTESGEH